jgi:DNA mismatch repair protein MSH2
LQQLEDVVFGRIDMSDSHTIMAVRLFAGSGQRMLGVAYAQPSSEILGVTEFIENDQFSNLEVI